MAPNRGSRCAREFWNLALLPRHACAFLRASMRARVAPFPAKDLGTDSARVAGRRARLPVPGNARWPGRSFDFRCGCGPLRSLLPVRRRVLARRRLVRFTQSESGLLVRETTRFNARESPIA